ncbi:MAG: hypothetical protein MUF31_09660 [Akkermansiaceae bacterium]|jgi:hypothetical protein|nr:hypothetical protein [Akkermansiaceae bacterium]
MTLEELHHFEHCDGTGGAGKPISTTWTAVANDKPGLGQDRHDLAYKRLGEISTLCDLVGAEGDPFGVDFGQSTDRCDRTAAHLSVSEHDRLLEMISKSDRCRACGARSKTRKGWQGANIKKELSSY